MKPSPCALRFGSLLGTLLLSSCNAFQHPPPVISTTQYSRIIATDFEGKPSAEYIAEGYVRSAEDGYRFSVVQRTIFCPKTLEFRYPFGRPVFVKASNLILLPTHKPLWLQAMDHQERVRLIEECAVVEE